MATQNNVHIPDDLLTAVNAAADVMGRLQIHHTRLSA